MSYDLTQTLTKGCTGIGLYMATKRKNRRPEIKLTPGRINKLIKKKSREIIGGKRVRKMKPVGGTLGAASSGKIYTQEEIRNFIMALGEENDTAR